MQAASENVSARLRSIAAELKRRFAFAALRQRISRNMGLRIISVFLAIGLWVFVNAGQRGSLISVQVPVSFRDLPVGYVVVNQHPDIVNLQISGPRTLLSLIQPSRLAVKLDLTGIGIGQASFRLSPDSFPVPRQTTVTGISPSQILLDIDKMVTQSTPVHLDLAGKAAPGYKVASAGVNPATITLRGPSKELARIDQIDTEPFDIDGISANVSCPIGLEVPGSLVKLEASEVMATVTIAPQIVSKEFRGIQVQVRDTDRKVKVEPQQINLTLRGPVLTLAKIDLSGAVYVEAGNISPGFHNLPVQVNLPDGVELVRESPEKVRLRMYNEKAASG
jgi:YbbR domain-containing protein